MRFDLHNGFLFRAPHIGVFAAVMICAGSACAQSSSQGPADLLHCLGPANNIQRLRDNLEVTSVYLKSSKDNFGPARQRAIDSIEAALGEFERLHGDPQLTPTPGKEKAPYLGSHGHPRMNRALTALNESENDLNVPACQSNRDLDQLRQEISKVKSAIDDAFSWNPPHSKH